MNQLTNWNGKFRSFWAEQNIIRKYASNDYLEEKYIIDGLVSSYWSVFNL